MSTAVVVRDLFHLLQHGIEAIRPARLVEAGLKLEQDSQGRRLLVVSERLLFPSTTPEPGQSGQATSFVVNRNVYLVAFGKAALGMTEAVLKLIGDEHLVSGIAIVPFNDATKLGATLREGHQLQELRLPGQSNAKMSYYFGARNNLPDQHSVAATRQVVEMCRKLKETDLLLTLISGGGSALFCSPTGQDDGGGQEQQLLATKLDTIRKLVNSGATINELNTVRSCLSNVKAGKFAKLAASKCSQIVSLIVSDVIDDPLDIIASGPTCTRLIRSIQDQASRALNVIKRQGLRDQIAPEVLAFLNSCANQVSDDDPSKGTLDSKVFNFLLGNNKIATTAMIRESKAPELAYDLSLNLGNNLSGEAKLVGAAFACLAFLLSEHRGNPKAGQLGELKRKLDSLPMYQSELRESLQMLETWLDATIWSDQELLAAKKLCISAGGETTVNLNSPSTLKPNSRGGRNQEMTLSFELTINLLLQSAADSSAQIVFSSFGSDGIDGPTDAAGAYYQHQHSGQATGSNGHQELLSYLLAHDSYSYFAKVGRLVKTGPTGTNVSDLQLLLVTF